jgi:hypothetical protein
VLLLKIVGKTLAGKINNASWPSKIKENHFLTGGDTLFIHNEQRGDAESEEKDEFSLGPVVVRKQEGRC